MKKHIFLIGSLLTALSMTATRPASVTPLLTTEWGQTSPYNDLCPEYAAGKRCKTSCVATAMAQIMRYHKYPANGVGSKSLKWSYGQLSATLTADFGATTYRWEEMLDNYRGEYTQAQAEAVATIMYHCGIAADAEYTPDSGAFIDDAFHAALDHFRYSSESVLADREYFDDATWSELVFDAIAAGFPVYYGGYTASYLGHAFVIDGYDSNGKAHVNWGFGAGGSYYDMSSLGSYVYGQSAMIFYPLGRPGHMQSWMVCSTGVSSPASNVTLGDKNASLIVKADIKNFTGNAPAVTFGLRLSDQAGNVTYAEGETLSLPDNRYVSLPSFTVPAAAFTYAGTFEAVPVYRTSTDSEWIPVKMLRKDADSAILITVSKTSGLETMADKDTTIDILTIGNTLALAPSATHDAKVYDLNGSHIATLTQSSPVTPALAAGVYIITTGNSSVKMRIN